MITIVVAFAVLHELVSQKAQEDVHHAREVASVTFTGVQDGDHGRHGPQPLGVFSSARTYPNHNSGNHLILYKALEICKSGLLLGLVDGYDWRPLTDYALVEAASSHLEPGYRCMEDDVWACGLRLTRYAG